jgi:hypothetical protein
MTVRAGTKSAAAIAVMEKMADKPMEKVVPKIAEAAGLDMDKAKHYYVLFVRKGLAPGEVPGKAAAAPKTAKEKTVKRMAKEVAAKAVKAVKPTAPTKSPEEIERIKAANMERMRSVLAKTKQSVRKNEEAPAFGENDAFAAPAFLTKDEVSALV